MKLKHLLLAGCVASFILAACSKDDSSTPTPTPTPTPTWPNMIGMWKVDSVDINTTKNGVVQPSQTVSAPSSLITLNGSADIRSDSTATLKMKLTAFIIPVLDTTINVNKWWRNNTQLFLRSGMDTLVFTYLTNTANKNVLFLDESSVTGTDTTRVKMKLTLSK